MQFKKIILTGIIVFFLSVGMGVLPAAAMAKGHPVFGKNWLPPGQAKKIQLQEEMMSKIENEAPDEENDIDDEEITESSYEMRKGPAWTRGEHPSVKGLRNAYRNLYRHGAPKWLLMKFRAKIMARGGTLEGMPWETKEYTIEVDGDSRVDLKHEQSVDLTFNIQDNEGNAADLAENYKIKLQVSDAENVLDSPVDGDNVTMGETAGVTETISVTADDSNTGTATVTAVLHNDENENDAVDENETVDKATVEYTVEEAVLTSGVLTSEDSDITLTNEGEKGPAYAAPEDEAVTFDYQLTDQAGEAIDVETDSTVIWTVKNTGEHDITVSQTGDGTLVVEPDEEVEFTKDISAGEDNDSVAVEADYPGQVTLSARLENEDENEDENETLAEINIFFYDDDNALDTESDIDLAGEVIAFDPGESDEDGTQILLENEENGHFYIQAAYETIVIESDDEDLAGTATEAELEDYLEHQTEVEIWLDDNAEDTTGDEDSIRIRL